jgi:Uma2 family endonuclease
MPMAAPVLPPPLRDGDRMTRDEFLRRWEGMPGVKWAELIDGVVHMPSPISNIHGDFHFRLSSWLTFYVTATPGCQAATAGTWLMSGDSAPQPDLALRIEWECGGQSRVEGAYPVGAPELIIEVSHTTGSMDAGAKLKLYERSGVQEYLIVRPKSKQIAWRELAEHKYRDLSASVDGIFRSNVFPGLWLNPDALWKRDLNALSATVCNGITSSGHTSFVRQLTKQKR